MAGRDDKDDPSHLSDIPHERKESRPDYSAPLPRKRLPKELQSTLDREDSDSWSSIYDGTAQESTESNVRYAAYASRVRTILLSAHRYVAYTSDIGESFRPIAHPYMVKGAYAVSWAYLVGDVGHEGYKAYIRNQRVMYPEKYAHEQPKTEGGTTIVEKIKGTAHQVEDKVKEVDAAVMQPGKVVPIEDYRAVMIQRAVFQGIASMGLPAFTIHSIVRYSGRALKNARNPALRTWAPIGLGLAAVPALPYMFDEPVEKATEFVFHKAFEMIGGPEAVGSRPETGREKLMLKESKAGSAKEKEL